MRILVAAILTASLFATNGFAGDLPLPAGTPAGTQTAQNNDYTLLYVAGIGAVIAGAVLLATSSGNGNTPVITTT